MSRPTPETLALRARILAMLPATTTEIREALASGKIETRIALVTLTRQGRIECFGGTWYVAGTYVPDMSKRRTLMVLGGSMRRDTCERYPECLFGWAATHGDRPCSCPIQCPSYVRRDMADDARVAMRGEGFQS